MTNPLKSAVLLTLLAGTAEAQEAADLFMDTLPALAVTSEHERQRQLGRPRELRDPDLVTVIRDGEVRVRVQPARSQRDIRFRREAKARTLAKTASSSLQLQGDAITTRGVRISSATVELAANLEEANGLPAVIAFGPRASLVNMDYARLNSTSVSLIDVANAIHPETRRCMRTLGIADDEGENPNRFLLVGDRLRDCEEVLRSREGDLLFAEGVPENLREVLRGVYEPVVSHFNGLLGSEPGMLFVAWNAGSLRSELRFERAWNRSNLLYVAGSSWEQVLAPQRISALSEAFAQEQVLRRFQVLQPSDPFTRSAVYYLLQLDKAGQQHAVQWLSAELPGWIGACARQIDALTSSAKRWAGIVSTECGLVVQFVYDATARARSSREESAFSTWRALFAASYRRGGAGVEPEDFLASSGDARRIISGLLEGAIDWPRIFADLDNVGVKLRILSDQPGFVVDVQSLVHFQP
jgi:hypothetical protein